MLDRQLAGDEGGAGAVAVVESCVNGEKRPIKGQFKAKQSFFQPFEEGNGVFNSKSDKLLASETLIEYYSLRFQIEFDFRDAKQYWGLEDFMNVKETQVGNFANFSLFMVTFSRLLSAKMEGLDRGSMLDLKTIFRARKYTRRILNSLGKNGEAFLIDDRIFQAAEIGRIHAKAA